MGLKFSLQVFITLFCVIYVINGINGLNNGLGRTPPMGWNSWNRVIFIGGINVYYFAIFFFFFY